MNERVNAFLDGELDASALSPEELEQARRFSGTSRAVRELLDVDAGKRDLTAQVMGRIAEEPAPAAAPAANRSPEAMARRLTHWLGVVLGGGWAWATRPRVMVLRPLRLAGPVAAVLMLAVLLPRTGVLAPNGEMVTVDADAAASEANTIMVQFRIEMPQASSVAVAGSFTGWEPRYELRETSPGVWSGLVPLQPGVHDYIFIVDGDDWIPDPHAPGIDDGFGGTNSRLILVSSQTRI